MGNAGSREPPREWTLFPPVFDTERAPVASEIDQSGLEVLRKQRLLHSLLTRHFCQPGNVRLYASIRPEVGKAFSARLHARAKGVQGEAAFATRLSKASTATFFACDDAIGSVVTSRFGSAVGDTGFHAEVYGLGRLRPHAEVNKMQGVAGFRGALGQRATCGGNVSIESTASIISGTLWALARPIVGTGLELGVDAKVRADQAPSIAAAVRYAPIKEFDREASHQARLITTAPQLAGDDSVAWRPYSAGLVPDYEVALLFDQNAKRLVASYCHHIPFVRRVRNPFEDVSVVGIANAIDIGCEMVYDSIKNASSLSFAVGWQINKNNLLKAKLSETAFAMCYAFKVWSQPSLSIALSGTFPLGERKRSPGLGLAVALENFGNVRYDRVARPRPTAAAETLRQELAAEGN